MPGASSPPAVPSRSVYARGVPATWQLKTLSERYGPKRVSLITGPAPCHLATKAASPASTLRASGGIGIGSPYASRTTRGSAHSEANAPLARAPRLNSSRRSSPCCRSMPMKNGAGSCFWRSALGRRQAAAQAGGADGGQRSACGAVGRAARDVPGAAARRAVAQARRRLGGGDPAHERLRDDRPCVALGGCIERSLVGRVAAGQYAVEGVG